MVCCVFTENQILIYVFLATSMDKINETKAVFRQFSDMDKRLKLSLLCSQQATKSLFLRTRRPSREPVKLASCIL